jgi:UDP-N-acetylglucosamine 4,6-dehydratase
MYAGKRTLVTGGTGSFGQTMVRRMLAADVAEVRVLSRDEGMHDQMRVELADPRVRFYVGDIRDYLSVERAAATSTWSSTQRR